MRRDFKSCDAAIKLQIPLETPYQHAQWNVFHLFHLLFINSQLYCDHGRISGFLSELFLVQKRTLTNHSVAGGHVIQGWTEDTSTSTNEHYLSATVFPPLSSQGYWPSGLHCSSSCWRPGFESHQYTEADNVDRFGVDSCCPCIRAWNLFFKEFSCLKSGLVWAL